MTGLTDYGGSKRFWYLGTDTYMLIKKIYLFWGGGTENALEWEKRDIENT